MRSILSVPLGKLHGRFSHLGVKLRGQLCVPTLIGRLFVRGYLPKRVARSLFHRSANITNCYEEETLTHLVNFVGRQLELELPLQYKQSWTLLFENFDDPYDGPALQCFTAYARDAQFIYDIGMNAGLYLYHGLAVAPRGARIFGFEPHQGLATLVKANLDRNHVANVYVEQACCSIKTGQVELHLTNTDHMSSLESEFLTDSGRPILATCRVRAVALDDFVTEKAAGADLIKIDVEGHEAAVMAGARRVIRDHRPTILIEISDRCLRAAFIAEMFSLEYRCFYLLSDRTVEMHSPEQLVSGRVPGFVNYVFASCARDPRRFSTVLE